MSCCCFLQYSSDLYFTIETSTSFFSNSCFNRLLILSWSSYFFLSFNIYIPCLVYFDSWFFQELIKLLVLGHEPFSLDVIFGNFFQQLMIQLIFIYHLALEAFYLTVSIVQQKLKLLIWLFLFHILHPEFFSPVIW